jgi:redox-sensitive bicupin YhaK (pirin superfamily)
MITLRRAEERGHAHHGWLESFHTSSFADYHDPAHMGFHSLRVINEDFVQPGRGFGTHPHRDMEIVTYVLEGALQHRDSLGTGSIIRPGEVQRMSAGTGVTHSEFNASPSEVVHLLQIWLLPSRLGLKPSYEQKSFPIDERRGRLRLIASPGAENGAVTIYTAAQIFAGSFDGGEEAVHILAPGHYGWVHLARGRARIDQHELSAGDAAAFTAESEVRISGIENSELLLFDLQ